MPKICHGQGNTDSGGCCWVNGQICSHRLTPSQIDAFVAQYKLNAQRRARIAAQLQGVSWACGIAALVIAQDPSLLNNRVAFNAAWDSNAEYVRDVRPAWIELEQQLGLVPGSYNCSTWGPYGNPLGISQCCFGEDSAVNTAKQAVLSVDAVTIRRSGGEA